MSREFRPIRTGSGTLLQSGIPKRSAPFGLLRARGLLLRGVVTATYVVDDPNHPTADDEPVAVYATVNRRNRDAAAAAVVRLVRGEK